MWLLINPPREDKNVDKISNKNTDPVLPDHDSPRDLANNFGDYFKDKIVKIRERLADSNDSPRVESTAACEKPSSPPPSLDTLTPTNCDEVKKIIKESKATSCRLDPIPTSLLKLVLHVLLPILTNRKIAISI